MIRYYFDENMYRAVAKGLVSRGIPVVMAVDVDMMEKDDDIEHLPYATKHNLVLVTLDRPFAGRTMRRANHAGLICLSGKIRFDIGRMIEILAEFAEQHTADEIIGRVFWLK